MATVKLQVLHNWRCDICRKVGGVAGGNASTAKDAREGLVTHFMDRHRATGRNPVKIEGMAFSRHIFVLVDGLRLSRERFRG